MVGRREVKGGAPTVQRTADTSARDRVCHAVRRLQEDLATMATALPEGCWPTMITPYNAQGKIDYPVLKALIGIPTVSLSRVLVCVCVCVCVSAR